MKKIINKHLSTIVAMMTVGVIEMYALHLGMNGAALSLSVALIAGLGGFELKEQIKKVIK